MRFLVSGHSLKFEGSIAAGKRPKIAVVAEKVGSFAASCFSKNTCTFGCHESIHEVALVMTGCFFPCLLFVPENDLEKRRQIERYSPLRDEQWPRN